jgi:hypothetical protein
MQRYQCKFETVTACGDDLALRSLLDSRQYDDDDGAAAREGISPEMWPVFGQLGRRRGSWPTTWWRIR